MANGEVLILKNAVAITGAGSGIGAATAIEFSNHKYHVFLIGRDVQKLKKTASLCQNSTEIITCDLQNSKSISNCAKSIKKITKSLSGIVNNAGIYKSVNPTEDSLENWGSQFQTNLFGAVQLTYELLPLLNKYAFITNVSSTLGLRPTGNSCAYSASKAAMNSWTQSLALALAPKKIRVNAVCPGLVETPIHGFDKMSSLLKKKTLETMKDFQPLGQVGKPEDIAKAIYFLSSTDSNWTTGTLLSVDGGINLK